PPRLLRAFTHAAPSQTSTLSLHDALPICMTLLITGTMLGALFAVVTLCTTVVAFPLLLDRDVGAFVAVETSFRAVLANPLPMLAWGLMVGAGLFIGSLPLFVGLAVVIPIFGHATWHLYRKVVEPASVIRGV